MQQMSPTEALNNLAQVAAAALLNDSDRNIIHTSVAVLQAAIIPKPKTETKPKGIKG